MFSKIFLLQKNVVRPLLRHNISRKPREVFKTRMFSRFDKIVLFFDINRELGTNVKR